MMEVISVLSLISVVAFASARNVNVCAAVCLLLLIGGLSLRASAEPHRKRATMEQCPTNTENELWANPCDYADGDGPPDYLKSQTIQETASLLAKTALYAYNKAYSYNEHMASLHSYPEFSPALLDNWKSEVWLRKTSYGDALPEEKVFNEKMPESYIDFVIVNIDAKLPSMYMGLKMVVAGLFRFYKEGLGDNVASDDFLKQNIFLTMNDVRAVLCYFEGLMHARCLEMRPLLDKDLPNFKNDISYGLLLYRDTLNYMDYLRQVFLKLAESDV